MNQIDTTLASKKMSPEVMPDTVKTQGALAGILTSPLLSSAGCSSSETQSSCSQMMAKELDVNGRDEFSDQDLDSSLTRLQRSSVALNTFANRMRAQYAFDEIDPSAGQGSRSYRVPQRSESTQVTECDRLDSKVLPLANMSDDEKKRRTSSRESLPGIGVAESAGRFFLQSAKQPDVFWDHYKSFLKEISGIIQAKSTIEPERKDKRFRDVVWKDNFLYRSVMQTYLAWDKEVGGWVDDLDLADADRRRSEFLHEQVSAMLSPTNSPLNPAAVKRAYQTGGKSVLTGLKHIVDDVHNNHGMPSQVREGSYTVGKDLAQSKGAVVFRSEVLELLQFQMDDDRPVQGRPVMIIPPQLNKYYVFDLTPKNSLVQYLKSQGVQPFVVSWRNPSKNNSMWNLDYYIQELEAAITAMCEITGSDQINLASACAGGITSMALLGYLQAANKPLVHSHSMFVTALQADDSSSLGLFATRKAVEVSRNLAHRKGFMDGKSLSHIFNWLRPTDLVWNFWVNNYLLGKEPPSMDVLYWDNDSTRLPAALHSDFLDIFVDDAFSTPGKLTVRGYAIDIQRLTMDFYCVGGDDDYLMPWKKCFEVPDLISSDCTFVLSTSGHIQSILRPPGIANTAFYTNDLASLDSSQSADQWLAAATKNDGSWWCHWAKWLSERGGELRPAPKSLGSVQYPALSPAPGLYVNEKVA